MIMNWNVCKHPIQGTDMQAGSRGVEKGVEQLSENERIIIGLISENPSVSKKEMQEKSWLGKKAIEYNVEQLKNKGIITRIGQDKGRHWEVVEK